MGVVDAFAKRLDCGRCFGVCSKVGMEISLVHAYFLYLGLYIR